MGPPAGREVRSYRGAGHRRRHRDRSVRPGLQTGAMPQALNGLRVVSFESRRSAEMAELIRNYGGEPIQAPAMPRVPLTDQREALAFGETLLRRRLGRADSADRCRHADVDRRVRDAGAERTRWVKGAWDGSRWSAAGPNRSPALKELASRRRSRCPSRIPGATCCRSWTASSGRGGKRVAFRSTARATKSCWPGFGSAALGGHGGPGVRVGAARGHGTTEGRHRSVGGGRSGGGAVHQRPPGRTTCFRVAAELGRADALRDALRGRTVVVSIGRHHYRGAPGPRASSPTYTPSTRRWDIC